MTEILVYSNRKRGFNIEKIDKKNWNEYDYNDYANAEKISFYVYDYIVRKQMPNEYVDILGNTICGYTNHNEHILVYCKVKEILNNDYGIEINTLPFKDDKLKLEIEKQEYINELKKLLNNNNTDYEDELILSTAKEMKDYFEDIRPYVEKIEEIDNKLGNIDYDKIDI